VIERLVVVVPAADEEQRIGRCLGALQVAGQELARSRGCEVRILVVLDGCTDRTSDIVASFPAVEAVLSSARSVGVARQRGARAAMQTPHDTGTLWLANTDADSSVPQNWLCHMVDAADAGADVVLGTVLPGASLPDSTRAAWMHRHGRRHREEHPYVHGANLGIRADVLENLGGWAALASGEDTDLADRAAAAGYRIRRTPEIPVLTSARWSGRAPAGFSTFLRALAAGAASDPVPAAP
jgi:GT2 family glycosyltransferase